MSSVICQQNSIFKRFNLRHSYDDVQVGILFGVYFIMKHDEYNFDFLSAIVVQWRIPHFHRDDPKTINADHPFVYTIRKGGTTLFIDNYVEPTNKTPLLYDFMTFAVSDGEKSHFCTNDVFHFLLLLAQPISLN